MTSNEQDLLRELGQLAAEQEGSAADDPELVSLCQGDLSAEARAELMRRAEEDPQVRDAAQAYEPLSEAARQRIADRIVGSLGAQGRAASRVESHGQAAGRVVPIRPRARPRRFNWVALPLAAAAALVLWLITPGQQGGADVELPRYTLRASGGVQHVRGAKHDAPKVAKLSPDGRLNLVARPQKAVSGDVSAAAFVRVGDAWKRLGLTAQVSSSGAVRVAVPAQKLVAAGVKGTSELCVLVGRPGVLDAEIGRLSFGDASGAGWQRFCILAGPADRAPR